MTHLFCDFGIICIFVSLKQLEHHIFSVGLITHLYRSMQMMCQSQFYAHRSSISCVHSLSIKTLSIILKGFCCAREPKELQWIMC